MHAKGFDVLNYEADPAAFLGQLISILAQARKEIADYKKEADTAQLSGYLRLSLMYACQLAGKRHSEILATELSELKPLRKFNLPAGRLPS
jgi:hypothetical protein